MDRSVEHEPRLNQLRRVDEKFFRESHNLFGSPISFPNTQGAKGSLRTMGTIYHEITPTRDSSPAASNHLIREHVSPLRPLNQNQGTYLDADDFTKKPCRSSSVSESPTCSHASWPEYDEEHPPPPRYGEPQPTESETPCYSLEAMSYGRPVYYYDDEPTYFGGYLEDDFRIPPPPPRPVGPPPPSSFAPHYCYEPYPSPHSETPYYYAPPPYATSPEEDSYYVQPPVPAHSPTATTSSTILEPTRREKTISISSQSRRSPIPGELQELDIVCGRGAPTNYHYGNQAFKDLVGEYQTGYLCAKRSDKPHLAMKIMDIVKDRGARFVRREKAAGRSMWVEIDAKGAYEKVCQALRQGAPEMRNKSLSAVAARKGLRERDE